MVYIPGETYQPAKSDFDLAQSLANEPTTTSEVIGANVEEAFMGIGSAASDFRALFIRANEFFKISPPIPKEDWNEENDNYRPGIQWYEGMTTNSAFHLANDYDRRQENADIISKATRGQAAIGTTLGFGAAILEPKNFITGVAVAILTKSAAGFFPAIAEYSSFLATARTIRGVAKPAAVEGAIAAGIAEPLNHYSAGVLQQDYTLADSLYNLTTSTVLSAGIAAIPPSVRRVFMTPDQRTVFDTVEKIKTLNMQNMDNALGQVLEGRGVDLDSASHVQMAEQKETLVSQRETLQKQKADIESAMNIAQLENSRNLDRVHFLEGEARYAEYGITDDMVPVGVSKEDLYTALKLMDTGETVSPDKSLLSFLRRTGGIKEESGELRALGITNRTLPGLLHNKKGKNLDDAALAAWEAGFFPNKMERPTINEFLDLLGDVVNNRITKGDSHVTDADRFLNEHGIDADVFLKNKKKNEANVAEIRAEIDRVKSTTTPDSTLTNHRQRIDDIDRQLTRYPSDQAIGAQSDKALRDSLDDSNSTAYDDNDINVVDEQIIAKFGDLDKQMQEEIESMLDEARLQSDDIPEEFLLTEQEANDIDEALDAALLCMTGR